MHFSRERVRLSCGGYFDADAVSEDFKIVAAISTSGARTSGGKNAVGKMLNFRSDMYFLLLSDAQRRLVILTEAGMHAQCQKEAAGGRVPKIITALHAELPSELKERSSHQGASPRARSPLASNRSHGLQTEERFHEGRRLRTGNRVIPLAQT